MFSFGMQSTGLPSTDDIIFIGGSETLNSDVVTSSMESRQQNNYPVIQQFLGLPADGPFQRGRSLFQL